MFPARIPHYFIDKFTEKGDIVFDPFSGRGTTPLQACAVGRIGIGNDLNPLAYVLTKAKVDPPAKKELLKRILDLEKSYKVQNISGEPDNIKMIFHDSTLSQLVFLKKHLNNEKSREDTFITALLMGIMHGGSRGFLSLSMPNTFSMSPNYIKSCIERDKMEKPKRDVFNCLIMKLKRIYADNIPEKRGYAFMNNSRNLKDVKEFLRTRNRRINLIVSSPPYLKVIKYGLYNWIRLWFLGVGPHEVDNKLDDALRLDEYNRFMFETMEELYDLMEDEGLIVWLIGDVKKGNNPQINLAQEVWQYYDNTKTGDKKFKFLTILDDNIDANSKVTKIWDEKKGKATMIDRLLIIYKNKIPEVINENVNWNIDYKNKSLI